MASVFALPLSSEQAPWTFSYPSKPLFLHHVVLSALWLSATPFLFAASKMTATAEFFWPWVRVKSSEYGTALPSVNTMSPTASGTALVPIISCTFPSEPTRQYFKSPPDCVLPGVTANLPHNDSTNSDSPPRTGCSNAVL